MVLWCGGKFSQNLLFLHKTNIGDPYKFNTVESIEHLSFFIEYAEHAYGLHYLIWQDLSFSTI